MVSAGASHVTEEQDDPYTVLHHSYCDQFINPFLYITGSINACEV